MARNRSPGLPPSHVLVRQRQEHAVPIPDAAPPTTPATPDDFSTELEEPLAHREARANAQDREPEPRPGLDADVGSQATDRSVGSRPSARPSKG